MALTSERPWFSLKQTGASVDFLSMSQAAVENTGTTTVVPSKPVTLTEEAKAHVRARRTSFTARFIVLREGKRSRAHRVIELMEWDDLTTAEELYARFRNAFQQNKDNMSPVDRDLRRAIAHADRSLTFFIREYNTRSNRSFIEALDDYGRSNSLLFGDDEQPKPGGWRMPQELKRLKIEDPKSFK